MNGIVLNKGQVFKSNNCGDFEILEETTDKNQEYKPFNTQRFKVRFLNTNTIKEFSWQDIRRGICNDYNFKSICNVACIGEGKYKSDDKYYLRWKAIIHRCYNLKDKKYLSYGAKGITVCEEWLNFQNFAKWLYKNDNYKDIYDFTVDKDILCKINNIDLKIYSPETCLLIPMELNGFLAGDSPISGVYKKGNKFYTQISLNYKKEKLGSFDTFEEAKQIYANAKYKQWIELIDMYNLTKELKEILLKYDFNWNF